jgi:hypothetical protein
MIRDLTTGETKFVQLIINSPDGRATDSLKGGITKKTALFEAKKYPDNVCDIIDSKESIENGK